LIRVNPEDISGRKLKETQPMETYRFYWCDPKGGYHLYGILPERRQDPDRRTQASVLNWAKRNLGSQFNMEDICFIQVTIDRNTGRILHPQKKVNFYKIFYKNYELKKRELLGVLTERRRNFRGKSPFEAGIKWARLIFGDFVKDKQALFIVPDELNLYPPQKKFKDQSEVNSLRAKNSFCS